MHALQSFLERRGTLSIIIAVTVTVFFAFAVVNAATTISTNVATDGNIYASTTLAVDGGAVFNDGAADSNFRIEGDTTTDLFVLDAGLDRIGIASTTPWGGLSIEGINLSSDAPILVVGAQGTATPFLIVDGNTGRVGIGASAPTATLNVDGSAIFNELGADNDFRIEGDTQTNLFVLDAGLDTVGIGSTTPWARLSVEANSLSSDAPAFVVGSQGTATPQFIIDGNTGLVGIASSTPAETLGVGGDVSVGSGATTTIFIDSTLADTGGCLQMRGTDSVLYRAYLISTTTSEGAENVGWQIEAGMCQ